MHTIDTTKNILSIYFAWFEFVSKSDYSLCALFQSEEICIRAWIVYKGKSDIQYERILGIIFTGCIVLEKAFTTAHDVVFFW